MKTITLAISDQKYDFIFDEKDSDYLTIRKYESRYDQEVELGTILIYKDQLEDVINQLMYIKELL